jgi:hypothetical protein
MLLPVACLARHRKVISDLTEEGSIYTTVDDDHFKSTDM